MLEVFKCNLWNREMEGDVELRKYYIIQASVCFFFLIIYSTEYFNDVPLKENFMIHCFLYVYNFIVKFHYHRKETQKESFYGFNNFFSLFLFSFIFY